MLANLARRLLRGETVVLENGGCYGADYVNVHDVARVAIDACESDCTGPVNIGSGRRVTIQALALLLQEIIGGGKIVVKPGRSYSGFPFLNITPALPLFRFAR